ncbi:MAG: hypothetical protein ABW096_06265 [Candidatus Thiodiazotropha sp.]
MKKIFSLIFLVLVSGAALSKPDSPITSNSAKPPFDCNHFLGSWVSSTYNHVQGYTNTQTVTYTDDKKMSLNIKIFQAGKLVEQGPSETRSWYCDGYLYVTINDPTVDKSPFGPEIKVYQILYASPNKIKYITLIGHSPGVTYTLERSNE